jgi:hypothetical protein
MSVTGWWGWAERQEIQEEGAVGRAKAAQEMLRVRRTGLKERQNAGKILRLGMPATERFFKGS